MTLLLLIGIATYAMLGIVYLYLRYHLDEIPDLWSPIQPVGFIFFWPIALFYDIIQRINRLLKKP